jgi:hypothetical protein
MIPLLLLDSITVFPNTNLTPAIAPSYILASTSAPPSNLSLASALSSTSAPTFTPCFLMLLSQLTCACTPTPISAPTYAPSSNTPPAHASSFTSAPPSILVYLFAPFSPQSRFSSNLAPTSAPASFPHLLMLLSHLTPASAPSSFSGHPSALLFELPLL